MDYESHATLRRYTDVAFSHTLIESADYATLRRDTPREYVTSLHTLPPLLRAIIAIAIIRYGY